METSLPKFSRAAQKILVAQNLGGCSPPRPPARTPMRSARKNFMPEGLSRNQSILCFDIILQHDWPIKLCLPILGFSLVGKRRVHVLIFSYIG